VALFQRGNTGQAVRASSSIPGVFLPTLIAGRRYVDGGVISPVPVDAARKMGANFIIAVDISAKPENVVNGAVGVMQQSVTIMGHKLNLAELSRADIVLQPRVAHIGAAQFAQKHAAILEGEKVTAQMLPEIKRKLRLKTEQLNVLPLKK
jgi:NTE family protein